MPGNADRSSCLSSGQPAKGDGDVIEPEGSPIAEGGAGIGVRHRRIVSECRPTVGKITAIANETSIFLGVRRQVEVAHEDDIVGTGDKASPSAQA